MNSNLHAIAPTKRRFTSAKVICVLACGIIGTIAPISYAQKFKPADQTKLDTLNKRLEKSKGEEAKAQDVLNQYKVFQVTGRVQAGDNRYASIYGKAIGVNDNKGPGSLYEKNYLYVRSPLDSQYNADYYNGYCTFEGVVDGRNTYLPIAIQPGYVDASNRLEKWEKLSNTIRAEIQTVYLPYSKEAKNKAAKEQADAIAKDNAQQKLAAEKRQREIAVANAEKEKQERVNEVREQLAQAKRGVEQAKIDQAAKQDADAEIARLQIEIDKAKAEKARIDADTQKQAQETANLKAQQLQETALKEQETIEKLTNTVSIIPGEQLGRIRLGMTEAQVLQLIGAPDSKLQLRKPKPRGLDKGNDVLRDFVPRKIRRDRYSLGAVDGLNINYVGSLLELKYFAIERGINEIGVDELKTDFVFDIFYIDGKVVQLESDSPQFFTADGQNLQSAQKFDLSDQKHDTDFIEDRQFVSINGYDIKELSETDQNRRLEGATNYGTVFGNSYSINRKGGISLCFEALSAKNGGLNSPPIPFPRSRLKLVIHSPNTVPYTGDYQLGISLLNKEDGLRGRKDSDADNVEERVFLVPLNNNPVSNAVNKAVEEKKESLKQKAKRKLGDFLP